MRHQCPVFLFKKIRILEVATTIFNHTLEKLVTSQKLRAPESRRMRTPRIILSGIIAHPTALEQFEARLVYHVLFERPNRRAIPIYKELFAILKYDVFSIE